jgi:hypothetical protein
MEIQCGVSCHDDARSAERVRVRHPVVRIGPNFAGVFDGQPVPTAEIFNPDDSTSRLTFFISAFVVQFSILKHPTRAVTSVNHLVVTVHQTKDVPSYRPLAMAFPGLASLFYVEIDKCHDGLPRTFRPTRYCEQPTEGEESPTFPPSIVLDDNLPRQIALRINAKSPGMYLVSIDARNIIWVGPRDPNCNATAVGYF